MASAISNKAKEIIAKARKFGSDVVIENGFVIFRPPPSIEIQMELASIGNNKLKKELERENSPK